MLVLTGSRSHPDATKDWDMGQAATILERFGQGPVLLLCRTGDDEHAARMVRGILKRRDLGILALDEPETRFRALAYCLLQLHSRAYGQAQTVVNALRPALRTRVALSSVSKLTNPSPTIGQHLQSMMPGSRFTLDLGEAQGRVTKVKDVAWDQPPQGSLAIWAADDEQNRVTGSLTSSGLHREPLLPMSRTWPAKSWAEMTMLITDPGPLVSRALAPLTRTICPYCGQMAEPQGCLLCGTWPNVPAQAPSASSPTQSRSSDESASTARRPAHPRHDPRSSGHLRGHVQLRPVDLLAGRPDDDRSQALAAGD